MAVYAPHVKITSTIITHYALILCHLDQSTESRRNPHGFPYLRIKKNGSSPLFFYILVAVAFNSFFALKVND